MFLSQGLSSEEEAVIEVVRFEEPTLEWIAYYKHRSLELEDVDKNVKRNIKCKCDPHKPECCDVCTGWNKSKKDKK